MSYRRTGSVEQIWYLIKYRVKSWLEWQDAKCWVKDIHPAWVHLATKAECKETRMIYRDKILKTYRRFVERAVEADGIS